MSGHGRERFYKAIQLTDGTEIATVEDAADYIERLPAKVRNAPPWPLVIAELIKAARHGGPFLITARVALSRAIHGAPPPPVGKPPRLRKRDRWKAARKARRSRS